MSKIKGGVAKSTKAIKDSLKKGGAGYLTRVPKDGSMTVRFLTEPEGNWVEYMEHYNADFNFFPCVEGDCVGCENQKDGDYPSKRFLANALDVEEGKVVPLVLPKTLAAALMRRYDRYGTLTDRDYTLMRTGDGFDTTYDVEAEAPTKVNVKRYDLLDLEEALEKQLPGAEVDDEDEDDEPEIPAKKFGGKKRRPAPEPEDEDDDVEDDEDDEEEVDEPEWTRDSLDGKSLRELKRIAHDNGYKPVDTKGLDVDALIDLIVGDDEGDDDEPSESDLKSMSLAQVKAQAKSEGVTVKPGQSKAELVDAIMSTRIPF